MNKVAAATAAFAAVLVGSSPAGAVSPPSQASATAKILRPLTIEVQQNLDFGTIILSGSTFANEVVRISQAGALTCGSSPGVLLTCTGAPKAARYKLTGTNNAIVKITSPSFDLTGAGTLPFTPDFPATVDLGPTGNSGTFFSIGGSITLSSSTPDGLYTGKFLVTADYQ